MAYAEVTSAAGSWTHPMLLPALPPHRVRDALAVLAETTGWPVAAFLFGVGEEAMTDLLLYRDPSRTHGTPAVDECDAAARALAETTGWTPAPEQAPADGVLVGVGLREGYSPTAPVHDPGEVARRLTAYGDDWSCRPAHLVSARLVDDTVRWYDEPGVVVHAPASLLPSIVQIAEDLAQQRFVVTDLARQRTYALAW
ncbi:hypothetical protein [Streptosporangium saharense]|uniref:hypothetical protein n=1 Tax=Streptosporangium saharense TaxID=1706840 RepID=UPI00341907C5